MIKILCVQVAECLKTETTGLQCTQAACFQYICEIICQYRFSPKDSVFRASDILHQCLCQSTLLANGWSEKP